jgi:hypothetical protein
MRKFLTQPVGRAPHMGLDMKIIIVTLKCTYMENYMTWKARDCDILWKTSESVL